jgi:hypothetical protein
VPRCCAYSDTVGSVYAGGTMAEPKDTFSLGRCAVVVFCCKMAPLRLAKVASNRFLAFADKIKGEKTEKIIYSSLLPVL